MKKIIAYLLTMTVVVLDPHFTFAQPNFWQQTGGPYTGRVYAVGVTHNGTVYVGGGESGIWISSDHGQTWLRKSSVRYVSCFAENARGDVFAGTAGFGIYRSTDRGTTWTLLKNGLPQYASLRSLPYLAVTTSGKLLAGTFGNGLYASTDNGENWARVIAGLTDSVFYSVIVSKDSVCYTSTRNGGVFRSTDDGVSWTNMGLRGRDPFSLYVHPTGTILAGLYQGGIVRSSDNGVTWSDVASTKRFILGFNGFSTGEILAGTTSEGILWSTDEGRSWSRVNFRDSVVLAMGVDTASRTQSIYVAAANGFYVSTLISATWKQIPFPNSMVSSLAISADGTIYAGGYGVSGIYYYGDRGVYYSTNRGESWTFIGQADSHVDGLAKTSDCLFGAFRYPGCVLTGYIGWTTNNGTTWNTSPDGQVFSAIAANTRGAVFARCRSNAVLRSINSGATWDTLRLHASQYFSKAPLAVASNGYLYTRITEPTVDKLVRSTDNGETWSDLDSTMTNGVVSLACNASNHIFGGCADGIIRSIDYGTTWTSAMFTKGLVISLATEGTTNIFAGTDSGKVYRSTDSGLTWIEISSGLNNERILDLKVAPDGFLYAATEGGGVYRSTTPVTAVRDNHNTITENFVLEQNYPNPFNPATNFRFTVPEAHQPSAEIGNLSTGITSGQFVSLKIHDLLGREVAILVNEEKPAGSYSVRWNATNIPSGVYFYRLTAEGFSETKKLSLIK